MGVLSDSYPGGSNITFGVRMAPIMFYTIGTMVTLVTCAPLIVVILVST